MPTPSNPQMEGKIQSLCERNFARDKALPVIDKHPKGDGKAITPQWAAWRAYQEKHGLGVGFMDTRKTWTVPTEYPPVDIDMSLREVRPRKILEDLET